MDPNLGPVNWLTPLEAVKRFIERSRELRAAKASIFERMEIEQLVHTTLGPPPGGRNPVDDLRSELDAVVSRAQRIVIESAADGKLIGFGHTSPDDPERTIIPSQHWHFLELDFHAAHARGEKLDYAGVRFLVLNDLTRAQQGEVVLLLEKIPRQCPEEASGEPNDRDERQEGSGEANDDDEREEVETELQPASRKERKGRKPIYRLVDKVFRGEFDSMGEYPTVTEVIGLLEDYDDPEWPAFKRYDKKTRVIHALDDDERPVEIPFRTFEKNISEIRSHLKG